MRTFFFEAFTGAHLKQVNKDTKIIRFGKVANASSIMTWEFLLNCTRDNALQFQIEETVSHALIENDIIKDYGAGVTL